MTTQTSRFEMNGKTYKTDAETVKVLRTVVPRAKASGDVSAVTAVMGLGLKAGRIVEEKPCQHPASRQYAWHAYNHVTDKLDALCICCCDCGAVLRGGATLASEEPQS